MNTRVKTTRQNIETYGSHPPYYKQGHEGYIEGWYDDYALVILDGKEHIALIHHSDLRVIHPTEPRLKPEL